MAGEMARDARQGKRGLSLAAPSGNLAAVTSWPIAVLLVAATVLAMEGVAWASHKYVMHGFAWAWHRDHHEPRGGKFQKNDLFALVGAMASIALFAAGSPWVMGAGAWWPGTWLGLGVLLYGLIYTLVHDGLVHQRWFRWVPRRGYARRLVQAHGLHHASASKDGGVSFGFVLVRDPATLRAELQRQQDAGPSPLPLAGGAGGGSEAVVAPSPDPSRKREGDFG
jgi:beta-carotene 3-hydroxylase